jgi:glyoxylase I family protein
VNLLSRLHHLAVVVADLGRAERFYCEILGLPVLRRLSDARGAPRAIWLELQGAFLALERAESPGGATRADQAPGFHCLALAIAPGDKQAWRERLEAAGFALVRESPFTLYVRDPDGNLVGLSHHPEVEELTVEG